MSVNIYIYIYISLNGPFRAIDHRSQINLTSENQITSCSESWWDGSRISPVSSDVSKEGHG